MTEDADTLRGHSAPLRHAAVGSETMEFSPSFGADFLLGSEDSLFVRNARAPEKERDGTGRWEGVVLVRVRVCVLSKTQAVLGRV